MRHLDVLGLGRLQVLWRGWAHELVELGWGWARQELRLLLHWGTLLLLLLHWWVLLLHGSELLLWQLLGLLLLHEILLL